MEVIKFDRIVSVTSEIQGHTAQNLLDGEISPQKNWMCEKGTDKASVILQLERAAILLSIHIGNAHSAFVEVLVGKAADSTDQFESLIPMSSFMNPHESKTGNNPNRTRFFNKSDFNEETASKAWDRIKVVCSQPFNKHVPFGLCFLKVHGEKEDKKATVAAGSVVKKVEEEEDEIKIGSFFKRKRISGGNEPLSVSEQMKEAEKESSLGKHTPISISKISAKMGEKQTMEKKAKREGLPSEKREKRKKVEEERTPPKKQKINVVPKTDEEKEKKRSKEEEKKDKKEKKKKEKKERKRMKPFGKLMEDVVLVISGFKNPLRGNIRSLALEMGARYSGDWESHCTHLVCAYMNTPKFNQVKGKGKIVTKKWVEKCHEDRIRYPWRRFALDRMDLKQPESEEEIEAGEEEEKDDYDDDGDDDGSEPEVEKTVEVPSVSDDKTSKSEGGCDDGEGESATKKTSTDPDDYDVPTDEEDKENGREDTTDYPMPYLPDMFSSKTFYVDPNLKNRSVIERYITAYNGVLVETFNENVEFYITERSGAAMDLFREEAPNMIAVKPSWIWEINSKQKWIPTTSHLVH